MTGELPPDSGIVELGDTVVLGVYDQLGITADSPDQTMLDFVLERVRATDGSETNAAPDEARKLLKKFEFPRQRWNQRINVLSGGERRRLQLLSILSRRPNFLVLDEPSVDLDVYTLQSLESFLVDEFGGVLLVVSHDRYFADKVTDHLFVFEGDGEIKDFPGSLSEYASAMVELESKAIPTKTSDSTTSALKEKDPSAVADRNAKWNTLRKSKKELEKTETAMDRLRSEAADVEAEMEASATEGWSVLANLTEKLNGINENIEEKELTWMTLAEEVESLSTELDL